MFVKKKKKYILQQQYSHVIYHVLEGQYSHQNFYLIIKYVNTWINYNSLYK